MSVEAGSRYAVVIFADGTVQCFGSANPGECDFASTPFGSILPSRVPELECVTDADAGTGIGAAATADGRVLVWGTDAGDELGDGAFVTSVPVGVPRLIPELEEIIQVAVRGSHVLARDVDGSVWWWGTVSMFDVPTYSQSPKRLSDVPQLDWIRAFVTSVCGGVRGEVWCWGRNDGSLGAPEDGEFNPPRKIVNVPALTDVAIDLESGCGVSEEHEVFCWGDNASGALGRGFEAEGYHAPEKVPDLPPVRKIEVGGGSVCVLSVAGEVYCWGANLAGTLSSSAAGTLPSPVRLDIDNVAEIAMGFDFIVALKRDGSVWSRGNAVRIGRKTDTLADALKFGRVEVL